jgi:serine/threonine protein kinase
MSALPDRVIDHLRAVMEEPDLSATRYVLGPEIGRGGMGVVYLARDTNLDRDVALKVLNHAETSEAKTLAKLEHPGTVPVHDAGVLPDGRTFYVMKLVQGVRLDAYIAALPEALRLVVRLCEPVAFAHARGILHGDLKPENVMLGSFGEVQVLDWGVGRILAGTEGYMAPEQTIGSADVRSDIFALGRILEFLLAGQTVPKPVRAIVRKAIEPDREARYQSALELAADINRFLDGWPVTAYRESAGERAIRWITRNKTLVALLVTYVLVRALIFLFVRR